MYLEDLPLSVSNGFLKDFDLAPAEAWLVLPAIIKPRVLFAKLVELLDQLALCSRTSANSDLRLRTEVVDQGARFCSFEIAEAALELSSFETQLDRILKKVELVAEELGPQFCGKRSLDLLKIADCRFVFG